MVSKKFIRAVKLSSEPGYELAHKAGIHPSTLSKLINGIEQVRGEDQRVLRVGKVLGLSEEECFEGNTDE